ncbi:MAG: thioredoxin family protein [Patescibacteria group bacterium]|nr:thioredoxin family protein [Patescibacteria group bacterium]
MKIQVLGSGCRTCKNLYEITKKAAAELKLETEVEYITGSEGTQKIIELGAMSSPVLAIDDKIVMTGFTPDLEKIKAAIQKGIPK